MANKSAFNQQQELAKLCNVNGTIVWDLYTDNDKNILNDKLKYLFPTYPLNSFDNDVTKICKANEKIELTKATIATVIWNQRKYGEGNILMSIIFVLHTPKVVERFSSLKNTTDYTWHPLFKIRKCRKNNMNSEDCCCIFIDSLGRVYQNWRDYITSNKLPKGAIIAPRKGIYKFDKDNMVVLEYLPTPASSTTEQILKIADYSTAALAIGAVITGAVLTIPAIAVAGPIMLGCSIIASAASGWSVGRSIGVLADRGKHEQGINVTDREARNCWLNITTGTIGIGAAGMSQTLNALSSSGKVAPQALAKAVIGVNGISAATSGVCVGNNIFDIIMKSHNNEEISSIDIVELSASLLVFTHSIYNIHLAKTIINQNQTGIFKSFINFFGQEQDVKVRNIIRSATAIGDFTKIGLSYEFIRPINNIPNNRFSDDVLEIMNKMNSGEVMSTSQIQRNQNENNDDELILPNSSSIDYGTAMFIIDIARKLSEMYFVGSVNSCVDTLLNIAETLCGTALNKFIDMAENFFLDIIQSLQSKYTILKVIPFETFIWQMFTIIRGFSNSRKITIQFLISESQRILKCLKDIYKKLIKTPEGEMKCNECGGFYTITNL